MGAAGAVASAAAAVRYRGRPSKDHRTIVNAILWRLATGVPWRDFLPARYGPWRDGVLPLPPLACTAGSGSERWRRSSSRPTRRRDLDWSLHFLGWHHGACPPCTRPGPKRGDGNQALAPLRGGFATKIHPRTERGGRPGLLVLTPGPRHEASQVTALLETGEIKRPGRGRSPDSGRIGWLADKGYTGRPIRTYLRRQRHRGGHYPAAATKCAAASRYRPPAAYREQRRRGASRSIRLKQHRAIATRYDKLQETYHCLAHHRLHPPLVVILQTGPSPNRIMLCSP